MTGKKWSSFPFARDLHRAAVMMYAVLAVDVLIMVFAVCTLLHEIERQVLLHTEIVRVPFPSAPASPASPARPGPAARLSVRPGYAIPVESTGSFGIYGGSCVPESRGAQVKLTYDVASRLSSSGYVRTLDGLNLTGCRALEFMVRGETGDEVFSIRLDDGQSSDQVHICRVFPQALPREWRKASVPLGDFPHIKSWYRLRGTLTIVFDHGFGMPYRGTIHIKDVQFVR